MSYYGVRIGKTPGVYETWAECNAQVKGFPKCQFKKFKTPEEAQQFVDGVAVPVESKFRERPEGTESEGFSGGPEDYDEDLTERNGGTRRKRPAHFGGERFSKGRGISSRGFPAQNGSVRHFSSNAITASQSQVNVRHHDPARTGSVYTDGCCRNNGQNGAFAGIGVFWADGSPHNVAEPLPGRASNNRAEIHAAERAVRQANEMGITKLVIHTDSKFLIQAMTEWIPNWITNGWRTQRGPVINREDFETLLDTIKRTEVEVEWKHIRGHTGVAGNEAADRLANEGALKSEEPELKGII